LRWRNDGHSHSSDPRLVSYQASMMVADVLALDGRTARVLTEPAVVEMTGGHHE
jgi:hypothetical protein